MTEKLTGKTVVVTAAAQGIGRASALAFAKAGATSKDWEAAASNVLGCSFEKLETAINGVAIRCGLGSMNVPGDPSCQVTPGKTACGRIDCVGEKPGKKVSTGR